MHRTGPRRPSPPPPKSRTPNEVVRKEAPASLHSHHHDPKDPVSAINSLRKLLNNTARSRFKMTQEEHKLSLYLLTVIEPFISASAQGSAEAHRTLTKQPNEILDMIVFHIDSRKDLLALGTTCQRLYSVVFPRHFDYRYLRVKPSSVNVWRHLIAHPLLACNVRELYIMDERSKGAELIPARVNEETDASAHGLEMHAKQQRLMVAALAKMTTLVSFSWACNNSLISFDDVSPTLFTCESLKEVEIMDNIMFSPSPTVDGPEATLSGSYETNEVPDLTSLAIRTAGNKCRLSKHPSLMRVQGFLVSRCLNLTTLRVGYDHHRPFIPCADHFLSLGRWPALRTLSLQNLWCSTHSGFEAATTFLAAHPLIEILHFELGRVHLDLPVGSLPNLKELMCGREAAVAILACPMNKDTMRPVEILKGFKLGGGRDGALLNCLRRYPGLRKIELLSYLDVEDVKRLGEAAPGVTWLDVGKRASGPAKAGAPAVPSVNEWAPALSALPELTTFHGVNFFYEFSDTASHSDRSRIKKNDEVASLLTWKCPKLRKVDYWDNSGKVVILGKEGEKFKWEVRRAKV